MTVSIGPVLALVALVFFGGCARVDLAAVEVTVEAPERLAVGEAAIWRVRVVNRGREAVPIQDLDVAQSLLAGVDLQESAIQPPIAGASRQVVGYLNLPLGLSLEPQQALDMLLPVTARDPGEDHPTGRFSGDIDVSVDNFRVKSARVSYAIDVPPVAAGGLDVPAEPTVAEPPPSSGGSGVAESSPPDGDGEGAEVPGEDEPAPPDPDPALAEPSGPATEASAGDDAAATTEPVAEPLPVP